jgi:CBS domain-containing protein
MQVSELLQRDIVTCTDRDTLERAAQLMWELDVGCLPVVNADGRVVGMTTDRDVCMAAFLQGAPLRSIAVSSVMSREVVTCRECDDVDAVAQAMRHRQIRRVPVIDEAGQLIGMVSINDLARAADAGKLPSSELASMLSAISHPRRTLRAA